MRVQIPSNAPISQELKVESCDELRDGADDAALFPDLSTFNSFILSITFRWMV